MKNNIKYYRLDDRFFDIDTNDTVDSTSRNNLVLQLIPSSSESFAPIVSEQYEVQAHFIHRASSHQLLVVKIKKLSSTLVGRAFFVPKIF